MSEKYHDTSRQLQRFAIGTFSVIFVTATILLYYLLIFDRYELLKYERKEKSSAFADLIKYNLSLSDLSEAQRIAESYKVSDDVQEIYLVIPQKKDILINVHRKGSLKFKPEKSFNVFDTTTLDSFRNDQEFIIFKKLSLLTFPLGNYGPEAEAIYLKIIFDNSLFIKKQLWSFLFVCTICLIYFLFMYFLIFFSIKRFTQPLKEITLILQNKSKTFQNAPWPKIDEKIAKNSLEVAQMISSYNLMQETQNILGNRLAQVKIDQELMNLAKRVMHDIRSPLAALKVVKETSQEHLSKDQVKLLAMSIDRITDIANTILPKNIISENVHKAENSFLWMLIEQIVSEKRVQYKNLKGISIDVEYLSSPFSLNAICYAQDFVRAVSNIIDNSVEARIDGTNLKLKLSVKALKNVIDIQVVDNGKGISQENVTKVFDEGFTFGKKQGSGLGLSQVKKSIESWSGNVMINSKPDIGTTVKIELVRSEPPKWLASEIKIHEYNNIVVLDDEEYVFDIIKDKFNPYKKSLKYYKHIEDFKNDLQNNNKSTILSFVDHDLKQEARGLDLIDQLSIQQHSFLLTGNYDDKQVQQRSIEAGIKILPKPLIHEITVIS